MLNKDSNNDSKSKSGGIGFFGALTLIFIILKLCGIINWSWIWVLAPSWIPIILAIAIIIVAIFIGIKKEIKKKEINKK